MLAPSKATPLGALPTANVPSVDPSLAFSLVTLLLDRFDTQMLTPSKAKPSGELPTAKVPRFDPSLAFSLVTLLPPKFATQMLAPSKATPMGRLPTAKVQVPAHAPSLARSLVTLPSDRFDTQRLAPSKATPSGPFPTPNDTVWFAPYQCRIAICSGFRVELTTPLAAMRPSAPDRSTKLANLPRRDFGRIEVCLSIVSPPQKIKIVRSLRSAFSSRWTMPTCLSYRHRIPR